MKPFHKLKRRKYPISASLPNIQRGYNPHSDLRLIKVNPIRLPFVSRDPIARRYLRQFIDKSNVFGGKDLWCLWIESISEEEINSSQEIRLALQESKQHEISENYRNSSIRNSSPQNTYIAIPIDLGDNYEYLPVAKFQPEIIAGYDLGIIDNDYTLALGIVSCRLFRVWKMKALEYLETTNRPGFGTVYNSFPMPDVSTEEKRSIEVGARQVEDARLYITGRSLRELYQEDMKPIQLRNAHKELNEVVFPCFGLSLDADENTIMERLISYYSMMTTF